MKNYSLLLLGIILSIAGIVFFMILKLKTLGGILLIVGLLISIINAFVFSKRKKYHK